MCHGNSISNCCYITVDLEGFVYSAVSYTASSKTSLLYPVLSAAAFFDYRSADY